MGLGNSKQYQSNLLKEYTIIQTNPTQNIRYLQHKKTQQEYLLKEFNFNDKKQCQKTLDKLTQLKIKLQGNKHVVPLKDFFMNSQDQYCSTFYKIYAVFQYAQRTLDNQICQRKLYDKKFTETQLWSILASCIVGLSHLQKFGIKHSALKSSNILLSKDGIIKISDPFAIGQQTNQDAVQTKKSLLHAYLSPQQTQTLQQQMIPPTYNTYKSDIFTLGMIMLEAGLLQYQDQDCYRDQKARIHWEGVRYNIDRMGQIYSDQIKNMVEFMLNRDERTRPDWIDLQEYVMKSGDQITKSMIQQQTKRGKNQGITSNKQITTKNVPTLNHDILPTITNNNIVSANYPISNSPIIYGQMSPRMLVIPQQPPAHQNYITNNISFTKYPPQQYQRLSQPTNPQITPNIGQNTFILSPNSSMNQGNNFSFSNSTNTVPQTLVRSNSTNQPIVGQLPPNIPPLRLSIIDLNRPTKNIFPKDTYMINTRFDQNLIIMMEEDQQGETNYSTKRENQPIIGSSTIPQQTNNRVTNPIMNIFQVKNNQNPTKPSPPNYNNQITNYTNPTKQTEIKNYQNPQTKGSTPGTINNFPQQALYHQQRPNSYKYNNKTPNVQFVSEEFKIGSRYEGYKLNGLRHGYGKFYYHDGGMYDGDWKQNKMEGFGKLYYQSSKLAYQGQWKNDQFMGRGILYNEIPETFNADFNYNNFDDVDDQWIKYQGQFQDDKKNGKGVLFLSNGQRFQGNFLADSIDGAGIFYCRNGNKVKGIWKANLKQK